MDDSDRSRDEPSGPETPSETGDEDGAVPDDESTDGDARNVAGDSIDGDDEEQAESSADGTGEDEDEADGLFYVPDADDPTDDSEAAEADTDDDGGDDGDDDEGGDDDDGDDEGGDDDDGDDEGGDDDDGDDEGGDDDDGDDDDGGVDLDDGIGGIDGPETDEEMPLAEHIEEMMRRLAVVFLFGGLATLVAVTESTVMINYFWDYHIPAPMENRPRLYGPLELPLTRLKVAGIAGVVVGLPAFVYQTYRFMKPGLYDSERRYYLAAVPTSLVLGTIGVAFAHFLVLPAIFSYFTTYTADAAVIAFGLAETFNLIVVMLAFMAIVFQIPLFIMLAIMMNLVTRQWLEDKRLIFWGAFLGIAFLFSPDPTGMAPIIVTLTMIVLYEGTLAILRWTGN
ncbi:twin-arginine translocase subunit TatC [Halorubrum sp. DTA98]|uniref:twin-arginine translocase subunit TatC n=1 Tax=Halorubrum sp. DTA98 TaxID=3402163 RepID=UPI003AAB53F4